MTVMRGIWLTAALCLAGSVAGLALESPVPVSPGSVDTVEAAPALCPTFSWGGVDGADSHEIVVYALTGSEATAAAPRGRPALRVTVPGSASSWTPAADRCLAEAAAYAWFVRALYRGRSASDWSDGAMFRTPAVAATPTRLEILRLVESYLAEASPTGATRRASAGLRRRGETDGAGVSAAARAQPPGASLDGSEITGLVVEVPAVASTITLGIVGVSAGTENESAGVVGAATGATGDVQGVLGLNGSSGGTGVLGINEAATGGVGVMGIDNASSGLTAGVVGITQNEEGYGGFFWNEEGGHLALVVAEPVGDPPTSADVKFSVSTRGAVRLKPTDLMPICDGSAEGLIYFDDSEDWLCVCDGASFKRADDGTDCA